MKFLTEIDVRKMYKDAPFEVYANAEGTRLTPGARQYLIDRGVKIDDGIVKRTFPKFDTEPKVEESKAENKVELKADVCEKLDVRTKKVLAILSAEILVVASEMLDLDNDLAEELFTLENHIKDYIKTSTCVDVNSIYKPCNVEFKKEEQEANDVKDADECFVLDSEHFKSSKGKEVAKLNYLMCVLREKQPLDNKVANDLMKCITRNIGQMICRTLRGNLCQKKS